MPADNDWALGVVDDVVGHRAHDGAAYLAQTTGTHHNVRSPLLFGDINNKRPRFLHVNHTAPLELKVREKNLFNNGTIVILFE